MPRFCALGCKPDGDTKVPLYRFPKDDYELQSWLSRQPVKFTEIRNHMAFCRRHWEGNCLVKKVSGGGERPTEPPSIFASFSKSMVPAPPPKPRQHIGKILSRNIQPDQLADFERTDKFTATDIKSGVVFGKIKDVFRDADAIQSSDNKLIVLSKERSGAVPKFTVYLTEIEKR